MKFYLTVAVMMFSIVYTTMIFGSEVVVVPEAILNIMNDFRGKGYYEKTGYKYIPGDKKVNFVCFSAGASPEKSVEVAHHPGNVHTVILHRYELHGFRKILLSDICQKSSKKKELSKNSSASIKDLSKYLGKISVKIRNEAVPKDTPSKDIEINRGKMDIFSDLGTKHLMCSLQTPKPINCATLSSDKQTIVTCGDDHVHKWEFRESFKMSNIYPDGKIKVRIGQYLDPRLVTIPANEHHHTHQETRVSASQRSIPRALKTITIAGIVIILLKLYFNQTVSKWWNKVFA